MDKRRLLKLANLLDADADNKKGIRFDMAGWGYVTDAKNPLSCGTSCCAMGLAALSGVFKRAGLTANITPVGNILFVWKGADVDGFTAAERLFDISTRESERLFFGLSNGAAAERAKAKQIRRFVAAGKI